MSIRYCKHCGAFIEIVCDQETYTCPQCEQTSERKDLMAPWTFEARVAQLTAMHTIMYNANDETIYGAWITVMPDEASKEDIADIALDDELYNECFDLFARLIKKDGMKW